MDMTLRLGNAIQAQQRPPPVGTSPASPTFNYPHLVPGWPPRPRGAEPRDGAHRAFDELSAAPWAGCHYVAIGQDETVCLHVKFAAIQTLPRRKAEARQSSASHLGVAVLCVNGEQPAASILLTNVGTNWSLSPFGGSAPHKNAYASRDTIAGQNTASRASWAIIKHKHFY